MSTPFAKSAASASSRQAEHPACREQAHGGSGWIVEPSDAHRGPSDRGVPMPGAGIHGPMQRVHIFSGRIAAGAAWSIDQLRQLELLKGLAFVLVTGAAYFWFAAHLLKRIAVQQQHLALIFQGVSDCLFLLQVEADDGYRFLCVNAAFLKVTGLTREQVDGKRIEEVLPGASLALVRSKYQEAIRERKTVSWEESAGYPAGRRVGEVTVTPLADKTGTSSSSPGWSATSPCASWRRENSSAPRKLQVLSRRLVEAQETERRHIALELHDEIGQALTVSEMNLQAALQSPGCDALKPRLQESLAAVERVLEQVRDLALNLRPSMLDDLGLEPALMWLTHRQAELAGLTGEVQADALEHRLEPEIETACFRVAQEALTNVVRHSPGESRDRGVAAGGRAAPPARARRWDRV